MNKTAANTNESCNCHMTSTDYLKTVMYWLMNIVIATAMLRAETQGQIGTAWLAGYICALGTFQVFITSPKLQPAFLSFLTFNVLLGIAFVNAYVGNYVLALVNLALAWISSSVAVEVRQHHDIIRNRHR
mgnify:FL=1